MASLRYAALRESEATSDPCSPECSLRALVSPARREEEGRAFFCKLSVRGGDSGQRRTQGITGRRLRERATQWTLS